MLHRAILFAFLITAPAFAQDAPLAGPKIGAAAAAAKSIVERGFDGLVKPAEPTPEEAALKLLTLSAEEQTRVHDILTRRARIIDDFMSKNLPLLTQFGVAEGAGNTKDKVALAYQAFIKLKPLTDLGPLQNQIIAALGPENSAAFQTILKDYWNAFVKDRRAVKKPDGNYPGRFEIMAGAKLESLGKEGKRAFKGMLGSGDLIFQLLFKDVALRPEQSEKIRPIISGFMERTKGEATNEENGQLFFTLLPLLDQAQQKQFVANIKGITGDYKPPKKPAKKPAK